MHKNYIIKFDVEGRINTDILLILMVYLCKRPIAHQMNQLLELFLNITKRKRIIMNAMELIECI